MKNISWRLKIRLILWSIITLAVLAVVYLTLVPFGRITYTYHQNGSELLGGKGFFGNFTPLDRVNTKSDNLKIIGDSVYFSLFTPRRFEKAKLIMVYRGFNYESYPIMEAGVMVDPILRNYRLYPISNYIIDRLSGEWKTKSENGVMLLQKEKKYGSVSELLADPPQSSELAFYNYQHNFPYQIKDYQAETKTISLPDLRGAYQFYTYINNETLNFSVDFLDLNQNLDQNGDPVQIYVYGSSSKAIAEYSLLDDGDMSDDGQMNAARHISINLPGLDQGVYKVEVKVNDDLVNQRISTTQTKMAFISRLWLYNHDYSEINISTDGTFIKAKALDPSGVGVISLNADFFDIPETYQQYLMDFSSPQSVNKVKVSNPETVIEASGVFSFSESALFNPDIKKLDVNSTLNNLKYIVARYSSPISLGVWKKATVEMDISDVYREKGQTNFMISIPGLLTEKNTVGAEIKSLQIELTGKSLIEKIKEYVK
ncbi:hypothetical protein COT98_04110 [Candidatus Falkowbacteria bacterium CG10_big_fil_rev_8_21_14_0_10_39_9]|uniref:Uncharacterized protein n=1 Tax=Candidatus Falkowbacteria bacterium CG10_big_fil_rev_8_21_14_0_10_39_9 TaxID=1974566 RepID=A0A2M6WNK8_9BACT|nr:MAG: hypothetical protein COT98_04110 [Candidatus Falkowbacteria bacterium CG10_big_fil_rev_8_21_14_0_10_39_9]